MLSTFMIDHFTALTAKVLTLKQNHLKRDREGYRYDFGQMVIWVKKGLSALTFFSWAPTSHWAPLETNRRALP